MPSAPRRSLPPPIRPDGWFAIEHVVEHYGDTPVAEAIFHGKTRAEWIELVFADGARLSLGDAGQTPYDIGGRYWTTGDVVEKLVSGRVTAIEMRPGLDLPELPDRAIRETLDVTIRTDRGAELKLTAHNDHNHDGEFNEAPGWGLTATPLPPEVKKPPAKKARKRR